MAAGEVRITCPHCQNQTSLPIAAVKRDNYYCSKCLEKVPLGNFRLSNTDDNRRTQPARPKKSSRAFRR